MERFISVDSGKSNTKVAILRQNKDEYSIETKSFLTRIGAGTFDDDDPGSKTYLVEYEGQVYKVGRGADKNAELDTSKMTFTHKLCTLYAIASICSENEVDDVHVAIGIPVKNYENIDERNKYREYILPDGEITVKYKETGTSPIVTKTFRIISKHVYPESLGAVATSPFNQSGTIAVVDIGHLNVNHTIFNCGEIDHDFSVTSTLGGNAIVTGLAQKLSALFAFINAKQVADVLGRSGNDRCLKPKKTNLEVEQKSKAVIDEYLLNHAKKIRDDCVSMQWSIDFLDFVFIGGGTKIIANELREVFGDQIYISQNPIFDNAIGFLMIMTGKLLRIDWGKQKK